MKEKVLAAHRNGLRTVILPKRNEQDIDDVPEEIKKTMKFHFVDTVDEVLDSALEPKRKSARANGKHVQASKKKTPARRTRTNGKSAARGR